MPNVKFRCPNGSCFNVWGQGQGHGHVIYIVTTKGGEHCVVDRLQKKSEMLSTTWYYEEKNVIHGFCFVMNPRKSSDFAECQISVSNLVVFYLLGLGLWLGIWSCHLLHGNNEGQITLSCPQITKKSKMLSITQYQPHGTMKKFFFMAFVFLSITRKSSDFAECQISVSKRVVFYLLVLGLGLVMSCSTW